MEFCQGAEKLVRDIALLEKHGILLLTQVAGFSLGEGILLYVTVYISITKRLH